MPAPISVIVPTLNAETTLSGCLEALMEGVDAGLIAELVVSDGGSTDDTTTLADAWGAGIVTGPASRGGQLRRGVAAARAEWFLVIHADTCLAPGWTEAVVPHLARREAGYFKLGFDRGGRLVAAWANLRARLFGLPYGDQGLLIRRDHYARVGGYAEIPLMEDVAMSRALRGALMQLDAVAVTRADKYRRQGWVRRGTRNLWSLLRYFAGVSPDKLAERYRRS
ncbi:TIGR04283 family arsenosugar biosynthesis glycosyltransferase [Tateyamaria omphalii]|uniref:TIGR04283 family arsenosugar biosynthesis glycosyltransferase n=1 Tax=Tateyamaria omphalii TaxID=299262 RepID=UPI001C9946BD|nr:TIGR04283 family arsenosugar biosynthesis glycosyltransferase [Tateyamaria omphalii]MBY5931992.1 TIGR04283 family arsenosugar biosynthesis glycosyltransferase [Tateyamaria omphalii]